MKLNARFFLSVVLSGFGSWLAGRWLPDVFVPSALSAAYASATQAGGSSSWFGFLSPSNIMMYALGLGSFFWLIAAALGVQRGFSSATKITVASGLLSVVLNFLLMGVNLGFTSYKWWSTLILVFCYAAFLLLRNRPQHRVSETSQPPLPEVPHK